MKHNLIVFLLSAILSIAGGKAQHFGTNESDTKPITWRANARMISNTEGVITFTATMTEGWHLYGMQMPADGPKPTRFSFEQKHGVVFNGKLSVDKAPIKKHDSLYNSEVEYWEGTVVFKQPFRISNQDVQGLRIKCYVDFMGCNDATCLPPERKTFNLRILPKR